MLSSDAAQGLPSLSVSYGAGGCFNLAAAMFSKNFNPPVFQVQVRSFSPESVWLFFCCYVLLEGLTIIWHLMCRSVLQNNENFHFIHVSFFNIWHLTTLQASEKFSQTSWIKSLWNNNHTVENLLSHLYKNCTVVGLELILHLRYLDLIKMTSKPNMGIFFSLNELFWKCIK